MAHRRPPQQAVAPDDGKPITVDPNLEDLRTIAAEIKLAERLGAKLKRRFTKVPTAAYGVEWASSDPATGKLSGFIHFVHGKPGDDGCEVRLSRVLRGLQVSAAAGVPFSVIAMRGGDTGYALLTEDMLEDCSMYVGAVGEQPDVLVKISEHSITRIKK